MVQGACLIVFTLTLRMKLRAQASLVGSRWVPSGHFSTNKQTNKHRTSSEEEENAGLAWAVCIAGASTDARALFHSTEQISGNFLIKDKEGAQGSLK